MTQRSTPPAALDPDPREAAALAPHRPTVPASAREPSTAWPAPLALNDLRSGFADPPRQAAPGMRWWWFGPSVTRPELERELKAMRDAGFSGVEVAYTYPLARATSEFGSAAFLSDLRFAAQLAHHLGLRFDLTLGSGWPFGGPHISTELAAQQLHWERREIGPSPLEVPVVSPWPGDELVAAYVGDGGLQEPPTSYDCVPVVAGRLIIEAGSGPRVVLLAYARLTGQNVKRASFGAEGLALDHYSAAATEAHLQTVADPMLEAVPSALVGSVFCDSLEVYGADWTGALPAEFARRRGYDLFPKLHLLTVDGAGAARLRADYHRTLSELYEENFVAVCQRWASRRGVPFRIQSYGSPPASISSYRYADMFEGEGWGWREITQTRWASSAAHLYGRRVVSAEAWTWVHSPSYRASPLDLKGEAHEHFLNGINQLIGHGWPYSPAEAEGMGWFFYAAAALDDRNPWWPAMPELNTYLSRLCWLLQQGEPVADVALYVPNDDLFATMGRAQDGSLDTWREATRRIPEAIPTAIRMAGLDYDLIDDDALTGTAPDRYLAVIVPTTTMLPKRTAKWFEQVVAAGGTVLTVDSTAEIPNALTVPCDGLADGLLKAVEADLKISPLISDLGFVHRRCPDSDVYFVANTGSTTHTFSLTTRVRAKTYEQWDPTSGRVLRTGPATRPIPVTLHPYEATVIVLHDHAVEQVPPPLEEGQRLVLSRPWQVKYPDQPVRPVELPHVWEEQSGRKHYSGQATYTTSIELAPRIGRTAIDFGPCDEVPDDGSDEHGIVGPSYRVAVRAPVGEIARVRVNGTECGLTWAPPYRVDISEAVHSGTNEIEVTIFNTAANSVAADEHITQLAAESEARYGRRFRMQDLEQAMATVRSGMLQVPSLLMDPR